MLGTTDISSLGNGTVTGAIGSTDISGLGSSLTAAISYLNANSLSAKSAFTGDIDATDIPVGVYQIAASSSVTNIPGSFGYGVFIQFPYYYCQLLINANNMLFRNRTGTPAVWNSWKTVTHS